VTRPVYDSLSLPSVDEPMDELSESRPEPSGAIAGEFVTETFDHDDGRQVMVYVPSARPEAIVFASDGQLISPWWRLLEAADVPRP
jgi:hypothetical protein